MNNQRSPSAGFTLTELMVVTILSAIVGMASLMMIVSGQKLLTHTEHQIRLQENARLFMHRLARELQESGRDQNGNLKVTIQDNTGTNGSDILRFSVPICPCGRNVMDDNGNVRSWGAPIIWGQTGCNNDPPVETNGKVIICHLPPGNPGNQQTLQVSPSSVKAHLAHGDWIGNCNTCNPTTYTNHYVEYSLDANNKVIRKILDSTLTTISQTTFALLVTDFQVSLNVAQTVVTVNTTFTQASQQTQTQTLMQTIKVILKNRG